MKIDGAYAMAGAMANVLGMYGDGTHNIDVGHAIEMRRLAAAVESVFTRADWESLENVVSDPSIITSHPRLLRSLYFGDDDYGACVQEVLYKLEKADPANIAAVRDYLAAISQLAGEPDGVQRLLRVGDKVLFKCDKPLVYVGELGSGGTGSTFLFRDETADMLFAMKKFDPSSDNDPDECYDRFIGEIKILLRVSHPHVVRVFNYYLYPQAKTGYIQMEYVEGVPIGDFTPTDATKPASEIFSDVISAFEALEAAGILHRDVRPANLLISPSGEAKLIDFGFGKRYGGETTLEDNSICLNWLYTAPEEVGRGKYDRATEVYYVGKLFQEAVERWGLAGTFPFSGVLDGMTAADPGRRFQTFADVRAAMSPAELEKHALDEEQLSVCREFLEALSGAASELGSTAAIVTDPAIALGRLDSLLGDCALEEALPNASLLVNCFVDGEFSYWTRSRPTISLLTDFRNTLASLDASAQASVMRNIALRLSLVPRKEDEIPF